MRGGIIGKKAGAAYSAIGLGLPLRSGFLAVLGAVAQVHIDQALVRHFVLFGELFKIDEAALFDADGDGKLEFAGVGVAPPLHLRKVVVVTHRVFVADRLAFLGHWLSSRI